MNEKIQWQVVSRVFKFPNRAAYEKNKDLPLKVGLGELPPEALPPEVECHEDRGNMLLNTGAANLWLCAIGHSNAKPWSSSTALLGVGDSDAAENANQTDLQGTNKAYAPMDQGFPYPAPPTGMIFQATFDEDSAMFAWKEWVIKENTSGICLNRRVSYRGTKGEDSIWVLQVRCDIT